MKAKPGQQAEDLERQEAGGLSFGSTPNVPVSLTKLSFILVFSSDRLVRERSGTEALTSADMTSVGGPGAAAGTDWPANG